MWLRIATILCADGIYSFMPLVCVGSLVLGITLIHFAVNS